MNSIMNNFFQDPFSQGSNQNRTNRNQQKSMTNNSFGDPFNNYPNSILSHQPHNPFNLVDQMMGRNMATFMVILLS